MLPTLRRLLADPNLGLTLLGDTPPAALEAMLDRSVEWVHSSDLADPTPFLSENQVLLTTGTQFGSDLASAGDYQPYVQRLREHGITALGFGTEVIRDGTPDGLLAACLSLGLPLFEVPYRTPFIAVARAAGDLVAEDRYARATWALRAQRAIALAALRPDGLSATLAELSTQLGHWVALFDASGTLDRVFPRGTFTAAPDALATVQHEARRLLARGQRSSSAVNAGGETLTLQTLGGHDHLRGVLALGGPRALDQASTEVVTSVIALAGLALEQNNALDRAQGLLRSGLMHTLLGGEQKLVEQISRQMWGELPAAPVLVAVVDAPAPRRDAITEYLEVRVEDSPGQLFFARQDDVMVVCLARSARGILSDLCTLFDLHAGLSDPTTYRELPRALDQGHQALARARESAPGVTEFGVVAQQGVLALLARTDAREVGLATLAPVLTHDRTHSTELLTTLRAWLLCNGHFGAAATQLGVHRHTVRTRIQLAEQLLSRDLNAFPARADLWAALLATDSTVAEPMIRP
ncbi:PucR family transcriptional regulator [Cryobacterium sp. PH29-G1]|uniref:PucR family transcriptional regulator n=1 Tax=Cryobacterium sp. PH29-G1 TaxID=3046211 RepID=UPI0024BBB132|nr:PucR family transcriptional regulator [Cryobacterium sp. PH29-G1]MDJ0349273.1 PucR family transcriptional regulator [Cryobacterium sp. PH29-G1]